MQAAAGLALINMAMSGKHSGPAKLARSAARTGNAMQVHIFRGPDRIFGFTAQSDGTNLPSQYAPWTVFKTMDLTIGTTQAGVNVTECLDDIQKHGFHLTDAHVRITERAVRK
jgi:hypothetical protein